MSAFDIEAGRVEISHFGDSSDGGIFGMDFAVATLKDPFEDAAVFAVAGPQKLSILVLAKPVHVENLWQLCVRLGSHLEPVRKVIPHVIAAKRKHGHGIVAQATNLSGDGGRGFAADNGAEEGAMLPVEGFGDQRNNTFASSTEEDGIDRHAFGILPFGSDRRALTGVNREPRIGMGRLSS